MCYEGHMPISATALHDEVERLVDDWAEPEPKASSR